MVVSLFTCCFPITFRYITLISLHNVHHAHLWGTSRWIHLPDDIIKVVHHAQEHKMPGKKENRNNLKLLYISILSEDTATIIQRYFSNLNYNNRFYFRFNVRHAFRNVKTFSHAFWEDGSYM